MSHTAAHCIGKVRVVCLFTGIEEQVLQYDQIAVLHFRHSTDGVTHNLVQLSTGLSIRR